MGRKAKTPFNHSINCTAEACGINKPEIDKKYEDFINGIQAEGAAKGDTRIKNSEFIEKLEGNFNKRELAYIAGVNLLPEPQNPLDILMDMFGGR